MQNRKRALLVAASCTALVAGGIVMIACGSDDSSGAGESGDGGITVDVIINVIDGAKPKDSGGGGDACSTEAYGETCEASTDCACSGVCSAARCVSPPQCGDAVLSWDGPTSNVDGTCIDDLAGFTLNWWLDDGGSPTDNSIDAGLPCVAGPSIACGDAGETAVQLNCGYRLTGLGNGTWDFTASAYTDGGLTSSPSIEAQKAITCHDGG
ncbi:MAG: hypothetical protein ACRELY_24290 [Polyangiaceae bacterium]